MGLGPVCTRRARRVRGGGYGWSGPPPTSKARRHCGGSTAPATPGRTRPPGRRWHP